jgi:hypothetical protein
VWCMSGKTGTRRETPDYTPCWLLLIEKPRGRCPQRYVERPRRAAARCSYTSQEGSPKQARCLIRNHKIKTKLKRRKRQLFALPAGGAESLAASRRDHAVCHRNTAEKLSACGPCEFVDGSRRTARGFCEEQGAWRPTSDRRQGQQGKQQPRQFRCCPAWCGQHAGCATMNDVIPVDSSR